jgi:hypothetical protein
VVAVTSCSIKFCWLHRWLFIRVRFQDGCQVGLGRNGSDGMPPTRSEVEDERLLKSFVVILFLLVCFVLLDVSFNIRILFAKI